jgi:hypothetical protein
MKHSRILLAFIITAAPGFLLCPSSFLFAQGSLTPPGAPAPTMKSLDQIEARKPIASAPFTISQSGSYYLTAKITVATGDAITINADNVTLDLNGFTMSSTAPSAIGTAIQLSNGRKHVAIHNGHISSGVTVSGGVYSGSGFGNGVSYPSVAPTNVRVTNLGVYGCRFAGINLGPNSTLIESCEVDTAGDLGLSAVSVSNSSAVRCGNYGIYANRASNSAGDSTGSGIGVRVTDAAEHCVGTSVTGTGVYAVDIAVNCKGYTTTSGTGLHANIAENCLGYSPTGGSAIDGSVVKNCYGLNDGNGAGVYAARSAENCYGASNTGEGIQATNAVNCYGYSNTYTGLDVNTAENCYGYSGASGGGVIASSTAQNCHGESTGNGIGVGAFNAQNCYGKSAGNNGVDATTAENCYGISTSGSGVLGTTAQNCYGISNNGTGIYAIHIASGCSGRSHSATGLNAFIAHVCFGYSDTATGLDTSHNVDSQ